QQPVEVPAEGGLVQPQPAADVARADRAHGRDRDQDVHLADPDLVGAEGVVVDAGDHSAEDPDAAGQALARDAAFGSGVASHDSVVYTTRRAVKSKAPIPCRPEPPAPH